MTPQPSPGGSYAKPPYRRLTARSISSVRSVFATMMLTGGLLWLPSTVAAAPVPASNTPLGASNYSSQPVCAAVGPGQARCLAVRLVPQTGAARAHNHPIGMSTRRAITAGRAADGAYGLTPADLHSGYNLPAEASTQQTIALVDAYNDPKAEEDLEIYSKEFGLPLCTKANGCFEQLNQQGNASPLPVAEGGWSLEASLDIETAHAVCPNCKILLVEADSAADSDLEVAENTAVAAGATEVSNSYGGGEAEGQDPEDAAFDHPGVVITASAGDAGYDNWDERVFEEIGASAQYPASSPDVVAVGGTRLDLVGGAWTGETVWNDGSTEAEGENGGVGGSGCSTNFTAPPWQQAVSDWSEVGCANKRAVADIAADADPYTGIAVYDTELYTETGGGSTVLGWIPVGGTSVGSPIIAAIFALAGGAQGVDYPASTLYAHLGSNSLHDVTVGSNGLCSKEFDGATGESRCTVTEEEADCDSKLICVAHAGYDGPSGVGSPDGIGAFEPLPTVSAVSPRKGSTGGSEPVMIEGTHLRGVTAVDFGQTAATELKVLSETEITARTPAHAAGTVEVTVTTPAGTSATGVADQFSYVQSSERFALENWTLAGSLTPKPIGQAITLPKASTFNGAGEVNPTTGAGSLSGEVRLPAFVTTLRVLGRIPVSLGMTLTQVGAAEGALSASKSAAAQETLTVPLRLNMGVASVSLLGLTIPADCTTTAPIALNLTDTLTLQALRSTGWQFAGTTSLSSLQCQGGLLGAVLGSALTGLLSGAGSSYSISVSPSHA